MAFLILCFAGALLIAFVRWLLAGFMSPRRLAGIEHAVDQTMRVVCLIWLAAFVALMVCAVIIGQSS